MPTPKSLAPGYVKMTYSGVLFPHHMTIPVYYDGAITPGSEPDIVLKNTTTQSVSEMLADFLTHIVPFFPDTVLFGLAEAHAVNADTGEDTFIYSWNADTVGSGATARVPCLQLVMTLKSKIGSLYRLYLMEPSYDPNIKSLPPFSDGAADSLADYLTGDLSPIWARKNAYLFTPVSLISKYNDKLRRQQGLA